ncbi:hypothetical protein IWQ60_008622 [Tieghemiomyces parasiticus]|uniref:G domain-containing protein n=1 Tax=Tieghemiomyces parasiticus TaxID=78921 RepID=A0A9W7ZS55_9FUNG|nr:hypothetical protein IWQ60_008622 [Tieghemiomyces parasiticus]
MGHRATGWVPNALVRHYAIADRLRRLKNLQSPQPPPPLSATSVEQPSTFVIPPAATSALAIETSPHGKPQPSERQSSSVAAGPAATLDTISEATDLKRVKRIKKAAKAKLRKPDQPKAKLPYNEREVDLDLQPAGIELRIPQASEPFHQPKDPHVIKVVMIGPANAGKSTLVNKLIGADVSVVAPIAQTTRTRIMAALTRGNRQVVFLDTPGVVVSDLRHRVSRELVTTPWQSLEEADHIVLVMDAYKSTFHTTAAEDEIFKRIKDCQTPATLVMNKTDLFAKDQTIIQELALHYKNLYPPVVSTVYTSGIQNETINALRQDLLNQVKPGPWLVSPRFTCDTPILTRVEDIVRAELFALLRGYLPYVIRQENIGWTEKPVEAAVARSGTGGSNSAVKTTGDSAGRPKPATETYDRILLIHQVLHVDNVRQKKIIVGADGKLIKEAALQASRKLTWALKKKVVLSLFVRVKTTNY